MQQMQQPHHRQTATLSCNGRRSFDVRDRRPGDDVIELQRLAAERSGLGGGMA
jgi:hypothetical protein